MADLEPLLVRIEEVLCDGHGTARTIAAAHRFQRTMLPEDLAQYAAHDAIVQKGMFAFVSDGVPNAHSEMSATGMYTVDVRLQMVYFLDHPEDSESVRRVAAEAASDMHRIRAALGYPGNLATTKNGDATNLAGGALQLSRWTVDRFSTDDSVLAASAILIGRLALSME